MRPLALADNKDMEFTPLSLFNFFVSRCRENLHVILAMSPIGDAFRNRLRKFPSLINCCTIDWFQVMSALHCILLCFNIFIKPASIVKYSSLFVLKRMYILYA